MDLSEQEKWSETENTEETEWEVEKVSNDVEEWLENLDNIINNIIENDNLNTELLKELEKTKLTLSEIQTKYNTLKELYDKLLSEKAALEMQPGSWEIPAKIKGIATLYARYDAWDTEAKESLIDSLAQLLTELSGKDIYSFLNNSNSNNIENLSDIDMSGWTSAPKIEKNNDEDLDGAALDIFWIDY